MLLILLWAALAVLALTGAGYSHYRYRVIHNRYYARLFGRDNETRVSDTSSSSRYQAPGRSVFLPLATLALLCLLVPMALII
ncbi:hypothetical protein ASE07_21095 [Noviherbaspirillum sp. Root189]|nr:hypothetical protein ASE07_21095 [Noviherbaspirillum sp. Root189]